MVSIIWFILSLFDVCSFSWWPVFIEGIILFFASGFVYVLNEDIVSGALSVFYCGAFVFAALKLFCGLTISPWWILLAWLWFVLALIVPGGLSITYLWFNHLNIITYSKWQLIFLIIVDAIFLVILIASVISSVIPKRKKGSKNI